MVDQEHTEPDGEFVDFAEQFMVLLSQEASAAQCSATTFKLHGTIQGVSLLVLLDSGSSHSFLNAAHYSLLSGFTLLQQPLHVCVVNDNIIQCTEELLDAAWSLQGFQFRSTFKVISIPCYDLILGMDWLEDHSPMHVDWTHKWMSITYHDQPTVICYVQPVLASDTLLEIRHIPDSASTTNQLCALTETSVLAPIQQLLTKFKSLFDTPSTLPPSRFCDHAIPLIDGARPVNVRPFRFSPAMKDEIEAQVAEMLHIGLIHPSSSAFSSPVILVRKKDHSWPFCVDYRHLNALTVKGKYLVPVIDELLDELFGASWFSILDLRVDFHQILLKDGEEHKTAF
jgi:hypothetical protein